MMPLLMRLPVCHGPLCRAVLSDRFGARVFATGGMLGTAVAFVLLTYLPDRFQSYGVFFGLLLFCPASAWACFGSRQTGQQ